jgi:hypothetical protein
MFTFILGLTALIVAGCAAYFSVQGLATLYAGAFLAVCIMAGSLEVGKLVAASYLHRYWNRTGFLLKTYLIIAIVSLMGITSLGIFGFLTSAYQQSHVKVEMLDTKKFTLDNQKQIAVSEIENLTKRIETLNQIRVIQEQRVQDAGNYRLPREQAYEAINKANSEIEESKNKINELSNQIKSINDEILILKTEESKSKDIGTLKFVAQLFNVDVSVIVKWFTLIIVLVFDPLAVALVLAYNNAILKKNKKEKILIEEEISDLIKEKTYVKVDSEKPVNYQDK